MINIDEIFKKVIDHEIKLKSDYSKLVKRLQNKVKDDELVKSIIIWSGEIASFFLQNTYV